VVQGLNNLHDKEQYAPALKNLLETFNKGLSLIKKFSHSKGWVRTLLKAGFNKEQFAELNQQLFRSISILNVGLSSQQLHNGEQDKEAQEADRQSLKKNQEEILQYFRDSLVVLKNKEDQQEVGLLQLPSVEDRLAVLIQKTPVVLSVSDAYIPYYAVEFQGSQQQGSRKIYQGDWGKKMQILRS
jgi:wyosine [tRNA(Phe)-imidazoG37] synthetase (radical SAM superfamily)